MNKLVRRSQLFVKRNSATMLTWVGAAGVVGTAVLAVKATPKAVALLEAAKEEKGEDLTKFEVIKTAGPAYIPAVAVGAGTVAAIFGANVLNKRQQASMASAYALLDRSYKDYKNKVKEMVGEDGEKEITTEIAKDKYKEVDIPAKNDDDEELFYDEFSGRYFNATPLRIKEAEYETNRLISGGYGFNINDFYKMIDIPPIESDNYGWNTSWLLEQFGQIWIDFIHEKVVMDDGLECTIIRLPIEPVYDYEYY